MTLVNSICLNKLLSLLSPLANDIHEPAIVRSAYLAITFKSAYNILIIWQNKIEYLSSITTYSEYQSEI